MIQPYFIVHMRFYTICLIVSLLWTMSFITIIITTDSKSPYQYDKPLYNTTTKYNILVSEEDSVQPTTIIIHKKTFLRKKVAREQVNHQYDELQSLRQQFLMIHRQLRIMERNYHHIEKNATLSITKRESQDTNESMNKIQQQYQELTETYYHINKRLQQLRPNVQHEY
jgi:hypothetical protein